MKWTTIRNFGRVKYFNLSYVVLFGVPILADLYQQLETRGATFNFPPNLKLLYAASLCFGVAIVVYQYFCPDIIKRYEAVEQYAESLRPLYERSNPDRKTEIILAHLEPTQQDLRMELAALQEPKNDAERRRVVELHELVYSSCVQRYLVKEWRNAIASRQLARWTSALLYCTGTGILVWLLLLRAFDVFGTR